MTEMPQAQPETLPPPPRPRCFLCEDHSPWAKCRVGSDEITVEYISTGPSLRIGTGAYAFELEIGYCPLCGRQLL